MSRRPSVLSVLAAGLFLAGCSDDGLTGVKPPADPGAAAASAAWTMVPITWQYHMMAAAGGTITCVNSDASTPFLFFPINWATEGTMTHLGRVDAQASSAAFSSCDVTIVGGYPVAASGGATVHIVGANGDAVDFSGVLTLDFITNAATGEWTITGGTGRFAGASGWLQTSEVPSPDGNGSVGSGSGMITPPGMLGH